MKSVDVPNYIGSYAYQLWLASLGILTTLERQGSKLFRELVKEGKRVENRQVDRDSLAATVVTTKAAYQKKLEAQLKEWDAQLGQLIVKAEKMTAEARSKVEAEISGLKTRRAVAQQKLDELRQRGEDAWDELKDGIEQMWTDINAALGRALSHFNK